MTSTHEAPPEAHERRRRAGDRPEGAERVAGVVVALTYVERDAIEQQFGVAARAAVDESVVRSFARELPDAVELSRAGRLVLRVPIGARKAEQSLGLARAAVAGDVHRTADTELRVTPMIGYAVVERGDVRTAWSRAGDAAAVALLRMDLVPVRWSPETPSERRGGRFADLATPVQVALSFVLALGLPYLGYELSAAFHVDRPVTWIAYVLVTAMVLVTALNLYAESLAAVEAIATEPPAAQGDLPPATAVIAAYLPNEAETIVETLRAFQALEYPGGLQIVLAYNTPNPLPVESTLRRLAATDDRILLLKVTGSTSKAQNVNAALNVVSGEIVGIFDADHHPEAGSFQRAWRWLSNGYGVVQGHCVIRNGDASWVARTVAVEFENIYAVSHPGRALLHGFGIFGGSNGYWRTDLLQEVRLRGTMLTEDIDSSLRVTLRGERIASDPGLISRELAPTTLRVLVGQRLRWAQGWSQVSVEYALSTIRSRRMSLRQKLGSLFLLGWREINPWVSLQMFPLVAFVLLHPQGRPFNWFVPLLVLSTAISALAGPFQVLISYFCAVPELRARRRWFLAYAFVNAFFYTEFKNTLARVAHIKHARGETLWRVTARAGAPATKDVPLADERWDAESSETAA